MEKKSPAVTSERIRPLGLVQISVLNIIDQHPENAFGSAITDEIMKRTGREFADAQIYMTLKRLEGQGMISSRHNELPVPSTGRRGRPRKYYELTASGQKALDDAGVYIPTANALRRPHKKGEANEDKEMGPLRPTLVG